MFKVQEVKMLSNAIKLAFDDSLNCENRLVKILRNKQRIYFLYDYMGRRVDTKIYDLVSGNWVLTKHKKFVYNRYKLIKEIELLANTSMQFVWLGDTLLALEANGTAYNYLADGNKNITQLINLTTGTTANRYDYTPFGKLAQTEEKIEQAFKFSSEYNESETGLVYYNYRYYNPTTGKWLSRDHLGENSEINLYGFAFRQPINFFDKLGLYSSTRHSYHPTKGKPYTNSNFYKWKNRKKADKKRLKKYHCVLKKLGVDKISYRGMYWAFQHLTKIIENDNVYIGTGRGKDINGEAMSINGFGREGIILSNKTYSDIKESVAVLMHEARHHSGFIQTWDFGKLKYFSWYALLDGEFIAATYAVEDKVRQLYRSKVHDVTTYFCCDKKKFSTDIFSAMDKILNDCGLANKKICAGKNNIGSTKGVSSKKNYNKYKKKCECK